MLYVTSIDSQQWFVITYTFINFDL